MRGVRKVGARRVGKPKQYRRYGRKARILRNPSGYMKVVRKCPEFWIQNSPTVAGTARLGWISGGAEVSYTGTVMSLGTTTIGMNGSSDIPFACRFSLSDLINYSDITTLADKYRLKAVYLRFIPNFTQNSVQSLYNYPSIQYFRDDDDSNPPTVSQLREKMGVKLKTFKPGQYVGVKVKFPKCSLITENYPSGTVSGVLKGNQWLNSADVSIPHYGLKGIISNMDLPAVANAKISIKVDVAYVLEAKDFQ